MAVAPWWENSRNFCRMQVSSKSKTDSESQLEFLDGELGFTRAA